MPAVRAADTGLNQKRFHSSRAHKLLTAAGTLSAACQPALEAAVAGPILQVKKLRLWGLSSCPKILQGEDGSPELVKMHILGLPSDLE